MQSDRRNSGQEKTPLYSLSKGRSIARKNGKYTVIISLLIFVIAGVIYTRTIGRISINMDTCIKGKLFYVKYIKGLRKLKDNDYVTFSFKGSKIFRENTKFIKFVGCMPGERIITRGLKYYCINKQEAHYLGKACVKTKITSKCPKHIVFNQIIPKNKLFAIGTAANSYDSKYWGFVDSKSITGRAYKIF